MGLVTGSFRGVRKCLDRTVSGHCNCCGQKTNGGWGVLAGRSAVSP